MGDKKKDFQEKLLLWYKNNGRDFPWRKKSATTYQRIVSEILLQRTKAETVKSFYKTFIDKYPSWKKLSESSETELGFFLKPIGLWRRKAVSLLNLAKVMSKRNGKFPREREKIEELPNVGQYIANSIILFSQQKPAPLLDANMARVLERYFGERKLADIRYDPYLQELAHLVVDCEEIFKINWAIIDFATLVCKIRNPLCDNCPISNQCRWFIEKVST